MSLRRDLGKMVLLPDKIKLHQCAARSAPHDTRVDSPPPLTKRISLPRLKRCGSESSVETNCSDILNMDKEFANPKEALRQAKIKIKSHDWDIVMRGMEDMAVLSKIRIQVQVKHPIHEANDKEDEISLIDWDTLGTLMTKLIGSFHIQRTRSIRLTCQILRELFKLMVHSVHRPQFDDAVNELIKRTADTSKMVRYDAQQALDVMIKNVPEQFSTRAILSQAPRHKNPVVRQTAMQLIGFIVESVTPIVLMTQLPMRETRKQIVNVLCSLIDDPNHEVRCQVRQTLLTLMSHDNFDEILNNDAEASVLKKADRSLTLLQYSTDIT